jgi:hypothetical protein
MSSCQPRLTKAADTLLALLKRDAATLKRRRSQVNRLRGRVYRALEELSCPACNGTGFPLVTQPVQPGHKIYPIRCNVCDGKGKIASPYRALTPATANPAT